MQYMLAAGAGWHAAAVAAAVAALQWVAAAVDAAPMGMLLETSTLGRMGPLQRQRQVQLQAWGPCHCSCVQVLLVLTPASGVCWGQAAAAAQRVQRAVKQQQQDPQPK
jgi:hypothetical protein